MSIVVSADRSCSISASAFWGEMYTVQNGLLRVRTSTLLMFCSLHKWFLNEYVPIRIDVE